MTPMIIVQGVSKQYRLRQNRPMTLHELFVKGVTGRLERAKTFWALKDIRFELAAGRSLGVIGHNGAGKSTLLRLICGIGMPSEGSIRRFGTISGLLDLGKGFHPDMTGRENLITGGMLNGLSRRQVKAVEGEIIRFAEMEDFIDQPVRTYSKGMYLRLAFATAIHLNPDVLVMDEVLAVGDHRFRRKCTGWLDRFRASGKTMILTSHDTDQIRHFCDEVLVLEEGHLDLKADPETAVRRYHELIQRRTERRAARLGGGEMSPATELIGGGLRMGTRECTLSEIRLFNEMGELNGPVPCGSGLSVEFSYQLGRHVPDAAFFLGIYSEAEVKCFETYMESLSDALGSSRPTGVVRCRFPSLPLNPGRYYVNLGLRPPDQSFIYDYYWQLHPFTVIHRDSAVHGRSGVLCLDPVFSLILDR